MTHTKPPRTLVQTFKQKHYGNFLIESNEPDVICLYRTGKDGSNLIMIERDKVEEFILAIREATNG